MTNPNLEDDRDYLKGKILALEKVLALVILGLSAERPRVIGAFEESLESLSEVAAEATSVRSSRIAEGVSSALDNIRELLRKRPSGSRLVPGVPYRGLSPWYWSKDLAMNSSK